MGDSKITPNPHTGIQLRRAQTPLPSGRTLYDQPEVEIGEFVGEEVPDEVTDPVAKSPAQSVAAVAPSLPPAAVPKKRKVVVLENPPAPKATKKVTVVVTSYGPASPVERAWVLSGAGVSVPIVPSDPQNKKPIRLVAVYLAFQVLDVEVNGYGDRTVTGIVRWHGLPHDRENLWHRKLEHNAGERRQQLIEALECFFAFAEARTGMALQFFAAPATNQATMRRVGFNYYSGTPGDPAVKVQVSMVGADAPYKAAKAFYESVNPYWPSEFLKWEFPFLDLDAIRKYWLGRRVAKFGMPQIRDDGLSAVERVGMLGSVAVLAGEVMASIFKIAFRGDVEAVRVMTENAHFLPRRTVMGTVFEDLL